MRITRRGLLVAGGVAGGGLVLGTVGLGAYAASFDRLELQRAAMGDRFKMVAQWIAIAPDGRVTVFGPHVEMGQGSQTGLLQIVLDELDADPSRTVFELAPPDPAFTVGDVIAGFLLEEEQLKTWTGRLAANALNRVCQLQGIQFTGGSTAIRFTGWRGIRRAAASARMMLAEAGAKQLGVPVAEVETDNGAVVHRASKKRVDYGELVDAAAAAKMPEEPVFKKREDYRFIGKPFPRIDIPEKVYGKPVYGIDVEVPNMRYAAVAPPDLANGTITRITNEAEVKKMRGVEAVLRFDDFVAVVADNPWRAEQAVRQVKADCAPPEGGPLDNEQLSEQRLAATKVADNDVLVHGERVEPLSGEKVVEATYTTPHFVHAPMEPLNATVWVEGGKTHLATGTQGPLATRLAAAKILDKPVEDVILHAHTMGGAFGRRNALAGASLNWVRQACLIHRAVGGAVKMTWSREAGVRMSAYHPADVAIMQAKIGCDGRPKQWLSRQYAPVAIAEEATPIYDIPHATVLSAGGTPALPFGYWRSVDSFCNTYFIECFVDELARAAEKDPVEYRLMILKPKSRHAKVLEQVKKMAGWSGSTKGDKGYGVAVAECFGSVIAEIAEVSLVDGRPKVHHVWCALDCGIAVNPGSVESQVQGGIFWGLSAALYGRIDFKDGAVAQGNFHDYRVAKFSDAPQIHVEIMDNPDAPIGGVGETSTPLIAPAVANAVAALTERRRDLPFVS